MATDISPESHWLLTGIDRELLIPVLETGQGDRYLPGEVIFREGDPSEGLFLIISGSARVVATNDDGETFLAIVGVDEVLGEMGVLDGRPRSGTASATAVCVTYYIPTEPFLDLLERSTSVCLRLLALLTARLRRANGRLGELPPTTISDASPMTHDPV